MSAADTSRACPWPAASSAAHGLELGRELRRPPLDLVDPRARRGAQALGGSCRCGRRRQRRTRGRIVDLRQTSEPDRAVGGLGRTNRGDPSPLGVGRVALGALGERRHPGCTSAGLVGERPPASLETRMALVGRLRLGPPPGDDVLEARHRRLEIAAPPLLDLEVVCGHVGGGVFAGELVGERVAQAAASRAWAWALAQAVCAAASSARAAASPAAVVAACVAAAAAAASAAAAARSSASSVLGQPVALGPGRHPRRLARIPGAPQLSALGVDAGALPGDRDSVLDRSRGRRRARRRR